MKWSWRVGRIAGIQILVHFTFAFLLLWIGVSAYLERHSIIDALLGIGFILLLFMVVVLHELGHALTARRFGVKTRDITLLPIGGVAHLDHIPEKPAEELLVAAAGPAVNVVLALLFAILLTATHGWGKVDEISLEGGNLLNKMFVVNVALVLFNLIPAFPMDGGRVLRALLALKLPFLDATRVAAAVGQSIAVVMAFVGFFFNPLLVFVALFVWFGAATESQSVEFRANLEGVTVANVMVTEFRTLDLEDTLDTAAQHVVAGFQEDFPITHEGKVVGVLTKARLLEALARGNPHRTVAESMERDFVVAAPTESAESVARKIASGCCSTVPVVEDGRTVGLFTLHNLGEYLTIGRAKTNPPPSAPTT